MPDGSNRSNLQVLEVNVLPPERQQLADAQACRSIQQDQGAFPQSQSAEQKLQFFGFQNIGNALPLRARTSGFDRMSRAEQK